MFRRLWIFLTKNEAKNTGRLFFLFIYIVGMLMPSGYAYFARMPSAAEMHVSTGKAEFSFSGKSGYALMIGGKSHTCGGPFLYEDKDCFSVDETAAVTGKNVAVTWFYQPAFPFFPNRRVAQIQMDGVDLLPDGYLSRALQIDKERAESGLGFLTFWMAFWWLVIEFIYWRRRNK